MNALLVDDSALARKIIACALKNCGITSVTQACDGYQALAYAEEERFDLLIIDFNMPHPNGLEVIRRLRSRELTVPIILLATDADLDRQDGVAMASGADGCLCKPFSDEMLRTVLGDVLGSDRLPVCPLVRTPTFNSLTRPRLGGVRNHSRVK